MCHFSLSLNWKYSLASYCRFQIFLSLLLMLKMGSLTWCCGEWNGVGSRYRIEKWVCYTWLKEKLCDKNSHIHAMLQVRKVQFVAIVVLYLSCGKPSATFLQCFEPWKIMQISCTACHLFWVLQNYSFLPWMLVEQRKFSYSKEDLCRASPTIEWVQSSIVGFILYGLGARKPARMLVN